MHTRILLYSHDTFGLGHLRRSRAIAHALVAAFQHLEVMIVSGSRDSLRFAFHPRVTCVPLPGIRKTMDGGYVSHPDTDTPLEETLALRRTLILKLTQAYRPDLVLVDKEPWGLSGELKPTLAWLTAQNTPLVLGLRDILDSPTVLLKEWQRKQVGDALTLYQHVWVYGDAQFYDTLQGIPESLCPRHKVHYTGYIRTTLPPSPAPPLPPFEVLVMDGGGGDGQTLMDWVVKTYSTDADLPPALAILGPQMHQTARQHLLEKAVTLPHLHCVDFLPTVEHAYARAKVIVGMGGYNTFCEILSFAKPALILPRCTPRTEQYLRILRADDLGLLTMLPLEEERQTPAFLGAALRNPPSVTSTSYPLPMSGLETVCALAQKICYKL